MLTVHNIEWVGGAATGHLRLLDQTVLPGRVEYIDCTTTERVWDSIKRLVVRGAPAIGIAAAYGCVIGAQHAREADPRDPNMIRQAVDVTAAYLATSRPTAVNLFWALKRMQGVAAEPGCTVDRLLVEARAIHDEDARMCRRIGEHALPLLQAACSLAGGEPRAALTHCNAGALATGGIGTATAPFYLARELNLPLRVFADETRPLLQGSRLTAYELLQAGIDVTVLCDDASATLMRDGRVGMVITGADRIAANGDTANKIGTYSLAVLARHHGLPFYVAAPTSTFDLSITDGGQIPIEERDPSEVVGDAAVSAYTPAFDVTPHDLITAIITEKGVIQPVNADAVKRQLHP